MIRLTNRRGIVFAGIGIAGLAAAFAAGSYWQTVAAVAVVYALASLSLVVLTGWTGQLNLHVSALGLGWGAYATYALLIWHVPPFFAIALACVLTLPFSAIVAAIAVRFRGLELAVATLAIGLIFERLAFRNLGKWLSRSDANISTFGSSFVPVSRPRIAQGDAAFLLYCILVAAVVFAVAVLVARGPVGRSIRALREREAMAETLGIPVLRYRTGTFMLSIVIAAAAGSLLSALKLGVTPDGYNIDLSFRLLAGAVIGGIASPGGAVIGGALTALLPEAVQFGPLKVFGGERLFLLFGIGMILTLWRLPLGLAGLLQRGARSTRDEPSDGADGMDGADLQMLSLALPAPSPRTYANPLERHARPTLLRASGVHVRFGGVVALDGAEISVSQGEIAALIGPNGAGKSTLFNCISGLIEPDAGRIYLGGRDVTELRPHDRAALGIGRTYQTVEAFRSMSVLDNLMVAGQPLRTAGAIASTLQLPRARREAAAIAERAHEVAATLGLAHVADRMAGDLPLGLLRVLEVGMALVPRPTLLLLDEPSAGLDPDETRSLAALIWHAHVQQDLTILLVEHDMDFVSSLAEHVFVLDFGSVIAQGPAAKIARDPIVLERYLGAAPEPLTKPKRSRKEAAGARR